MHLEGQRQFLGRQLHSIRICGKNAEMDIYINLEGGKTCAASPARVTRPIDHLLQLLAEKVNGLDRRTSIQSTGNWMSEIERIASPS
jgi:hypothetical protein